MAAWQPAHAQATPAMTDADFDEMKRRTADIMPELVGVYKP